MKKIVLLVGALVASATAFAVPDPNYALVQTGVTTAIGDFVPVMVAIGVAVIGLIFVKSLLRNGGSAARLRT